jgi:hypothetical protein
MRQTDKRQGIKRGASKRQEYRTGTGQWNRQTGDRVDREAGTGTNRQTRRDGRAGQRRKEEGR